jgi:hypothetical protein
MNWDEQLSLAEESTGWPRHAVSAKGLGLVLWISACFQLAEGNRGRAEELWRARPQNWENVRRRRP